MMRTAQVRLDVTAQQAAALTALRSADADACNRLVPFVVAHRVWNRVALHNLAYNALRAATPLGSQMGCNAIFSVCKADKAQKALGRIRKDQPPPAIRFDHASVHFDQRTYTLRGDGVSLYTAQGRMTIPLRLGAHQRRILESGKPKEAELVLRQGKWFFNLVVESGDVKPLASGPVMGVDVGENNLAAVSTGKVFGGEHLRDRRDRSKAAGIVVEYVNPAYTSQTCACCGSLGKRLKHRFVCDKCGLRAHADLNASRNLARIGSGAPLPMATVNAPDVGGVDRGNHVCASQ